MKIYGWGLEINRTGFTPGFPGSIFVSDPNSFRFEVWAEMMSEGCFWEPPIFESYRRVLSKASSIEEASEIARSAGSEITKMWRQRTS